MVAEEAAARWSKKNKNPIIWQCGEKTRAGDPYQKDLDVYDVYHAHSGLRKS